MTTPPKPAMDLLAQFTDACLQRELPTDRLRVLWWELGGSDAGWFFDWQGWRPRSYKQEQSRRNEPPTGLYRREPDSILHVHERVLPAASCAWLVLTPDEAMSAGYEDRIDRSRGDDALPRYIKVTLWIDEVYPVHVLEHRAVRARPRRTARGDDFVFNGALGEICCIHCGAEIWYGAAMYETVTQTLLGTRDTPQEQIRLAEFFLRGKDNRGYPVGDAGSNRARVAPMLEQHQRESHPLACKGSRAPY